MPLVIADRALTWWQSPRQAPTNKAVQTDGQRLADGGHGPGVWQDVRVERVDEPRQLVGEVV